ncbi:MAG: NAD(P)-dependent oxidoreductase [Nitrososphaera sp.]|nr:NAD(P)-dependent oxidoreductase [Nitrososphaera sp.]
MSTDYVFDGNTRTPYSEYANTSDKVKVWVVQFPVLKGSFRNLERFIKHGKRGKPFYQWETRDRFLKKENHMTLEEAVAFVHKARNHHLYLEGVDRQIDDSRLYNTLTGEEIPCTAL